MKPLQEIDIVESGRRLGHDLHRYSRIAVQPCWPSSVREGFEESVPLTHGTRADTEWSIDRLNNDGASAASNLAVMSVRANRAKGRLSVEAALAKSRLAHDSGGLSAMEWLRLAVLVEGPAFAQQLYLAPFLPLFAPLPCRSVRLALQQIQRLFTLQAARPAGKNSLVRAPRQASPDERAHLGLRIWGDAVHEGLKRLAGSDQARDVWLQPATIIALIRWRESLDDTSGARAAAISGQLEGGRRVTASSLQVWHLPTRGYLSRSAHQQIACKPA